jgi:hypothetical protein
MPDFYSGTLDTLQELFRHVGIQIGVEKTLVDAIGSETIERYQAEADQFINSQLNQTFEVPIVKITRNGVEGFPEEIKYIARRLVASEVILNEFTEIAPNVSRAAVTLRHRATQRLGTYSNGTLVPSNLIDGQRPRSRNRFVRPTTPPPEVEPPYTQEALP